MHRIYIRLAVILALVNFISGCAVVVEPVTLPDISKATSQQEQFNIEVSPLTFEVAKELNSEEYPRLVSRPGRAFSADVVSETNFSLAQFPPNSQRYTYKLGIADEVILTQYAEPTTSLVNGTLLDAMGTPEPQALSSTGFERSPIITTVGRVGSDGAILLIGVGRIDARGRDITELRSEIRNILIGNGKMPNFQLEIQGFNSQKAYITTDRPPSEKPDPLKFVRAITDKGLTLRELIAEAGIPFNERLLTVVRLQRNEQTFSLTLAELFSEKAPDVYLKDKDHVFIQNFAYVDAKVYLVGGVKPRVLKISPEKRQTLADALFSEDGPMEEPTAQRSAVYLLRGQQPVKAYHIDAQNPARIQVADSVELRPNDIVFVGEQPINTFNRVLSTILPIRLFSKDTIGQ